jgi:hypothetical protein
MLAAKLLKYILRAIGSVGEVHYSLDAAGVSDSFESTLHLLRKL